MNKSSCLIIGVGPGLGLSLAETFAKKNFSISMVARNRSKLEKYKSEFETKGYEAHPFAVDISDKKSLQQTIGDIIVKLQGIDVLLFNASVMTEATPGGIEPATMEQDMKVNFISAVVAAQAVLPHMKKQTAGTLLFTGSAAALNPIPSIVSLSAGKAALRFYALALGEELKDTNVYAGTITINGTMAKGTHFDPESIAEKFWWMYQTKPLEREFIYE